MQKKIENFSKKSKIFEKKIVNFSKKKSKIFQKKNPKFFQKKNPKFFQKKSKKFENSPWQLSWVLNCGLSTISHLYRLCNANYC